MTTVIRNLIVLSSVLLLVACGTKPVYTEYHNLPLQGWHMDSLPAAAVIIHCFKSQGTLAEIPGIVEMPQTA